MDKKISYTVFDFFRGQSLEQYLNERLMPCAQALAMGRKLGGTVEKLHELGIVHRNIKPSNVLLCNNGDVKLLDLGMAVGPGMKPLPLYSVPLSGNPFMSPDLMADPLHVDPRDDIYSVGQMLRYAIGGKTAMPTWSIGTTTNKKGQA
ncbi:MAG: protein kinase [Deltaproteobacteria bacterium]|nr:protein kinase [Deltaproteobacteria bacterium]